MLIIGITIGYGIGLCKSLKDLEKHCQQLLTLNDDWFEHLKNHTDAIYKLIEDFKDDEFIQ